ncbi:hypothetical protein B0T13DRAFT_452336 [Neurospora crassa]|nr:hypothetical protein B0T13DRAFT_452336 [Neurospora crassa]
MWNYVCVITKSLYAQLSGSLKNRGQHKARRRLCSNRELDSIAGIRGMVQTEGRTVWGESFKAERGRTGCDAVCSSQWLVYYAARSAAPLTGTWGSENLRATSAMEPTVCPFNDRHSSPSTVASCSAISLTKVGSLAVVVSTWSHGKTPPDMYQQILIWRMRGEGTASQADVLTKFGDNVGQGGRYCWRKYTKTNHIITMNPGDDDGNILVPASDSALGCGS